MHWVTSSYALLLKSSGCGAGLAVWRGGTVSLRSHILLLLKGWPQLSPSASLHPLWQRLLSPLNGWRLHLWDKFCLCLTCSMEPALESCHQSAGSDSRADWECSLRSKPSVSLLNRRHSCCCAVISAWPPGGEEKQGYPQHTQKMRIQPKVLPRPVQRRWVRSAAGPSAADLTAVLTTEFWRAKPRDRLSAVLLKCALVKYFSALSKHYK